jgi:hypothetical protein
MFESSNQKSCRNPRILYENGRCFTSNCGKILNSTLLREYQKWKESVNKELTDNDMKEITIYLNESQYTLHLWTFKTLVFCKFLICNLF